MIDISTLNLDQLEELLDRVYIRIERLKQSVNIALQDIKIGDCFVKEGYNYYYFYKIKEISENGYEADCTYFDFDDYIEDITNLFNAVYIDLSETLDFIPISPEVFEQASKLRMDFVNQLCKSKDQLHSDIKTLING